MLMTLALCLVPPPSHDLMTLALCLVPPPSHCTMSNKKGTHIMYGVVHFSMKPCLIMQKAALSQPGNEARLLVERNTSGKCAITQYGKIYV